MTQVRIHTVLSNTDKLNLLLKIAHECFDKKQTLLILAPDETAANFIDSYLWKVPQESFLPHFTSNDTNKDFISITTANKNLNSASHLLNLTATIPSFARECSTIYELLDKTSPQKLVQSQEKFESYKKDYPELELIEK